MCKKATKHVAKEGVEDNSWLRTPTKNIWWLYRRPASTEASDY